MNVTPLVDVVLVLLIIFMVVTPLLAKQFSLNLPKNEESNEPPDPNNKSIVLTVDKAGSMRVNGQLIARSELRERLPRMLAAKSQKVAYFDADDDTPYAVAVEAMDFARGAGAKNLAIMTEKVAVSSP